MILFYFFFVFPIVLIDFYNYNMMFCRVSRIIQYTKSKSANLFTFSNEKNKRIKILNDPSQVSKLIFDNDGLCKIY